MKNLFKNYREFESDRFVYMVETANNTLTQKSILSTTTPAETTTIDQKITNTITSLNKKIDTINGNEPGTKKLKTLLKQHLETTLEKIKTEHNNETQAVQDNTERLGKAIKAINDFITKIQSHIDNADKHIEHIENMDTLKGDDEAEKKQTKIKILTSLIKNKYTDIDQNFAKQIGEYIANENNDINVLQGDIDAHLPKKEGVKPASGYLDSLGKNNTELENKLGKTINKAIKNLLNSAPSPEQSEEALTAGITVFNNILTDLYLKEDSKIREPFAKALATQFNVHIGENGTPQYFIDINNNNIIEAKDINNKVSKKLDRMNWSPFKAKRYLSWTENMVENAKKDMIKANSKTTEELVTDTDSQKIIEGSMVIKSKIREIEESKVKEQETKNETLAKQDAEEKAEEAAEETKIAQEKAEKNTKTNKPKAEAVNTYITTLNSTETNPKFNIGTLNTNNTNLTKDKPKLTSDLKVDGKQIGTITINDLSEVETANEEPKDVSNKATINVTIQINNGEKIETTLVGLETKLADSELTALKEQHATAQKNKKTIDTQSTTAFTAIKVDGLTTEKIDLSTNIDLSNPQNTPINIAKINLPSESITKPPATTTAIATVQMVVTKNEDGKLTYKYKIEKTELNDIKAVNTHLTENKDTLIAAKKAKLESDVAKELGVPLDTIKNFGITDLIALFQMISEALQADPPDLSIIGDLYKDISEGKSVIGIIEKTKDIYEKKVNEETNAKTLLEYCNGTGTSKTLTDENKKPLRYKSFLKQIARKKLAEKLNITIADNGFKKIKGGGITQITTVGSGVIEINTTSTNPKMTHYTLEGEEGKETKKYTVGSENKMKSLNDNLLTTLTTNLTAATTDAAATDAAA